jgi:signal transduction histidine kinase
VPDATEQVDHEGQDLEVLRERGIGVDHGEVHDRVRAFRVPRFRGPPFDHGADVLRRKLILNLFPLVLVLLIGGVAAIWVLQDVLGRLDHIKDQADAVALLSRELARFRGIVLGMGIVFVVMINFTVVMLVRAGATVLRPVNALVNATRQLAEGKFDHRVRLKENDEFDELAEAYNNLAEHLQETERQRMNVLAQVALALNHELNNAMATIELQLGMLGRGAAGDLQAERRLRTIHDSMGRMKGTVQALRDARRIVLTDYSPGLKMLDLAQSAQPAQQEDAAPSPAAAS